MATLIKTPEVESEPVEKREVADSIQKKRNSRVLLAVAALMTGLSIAVPAAVMVFIYPLNHAEFHYVDGMWQGEIWWSYVYTGIALSIGFGLAGIVLAIRSEVTAHGSRERQSVKSSASLATIARVALSLSILDLILGPAAFLVLGVSAGMVVTIAFGLTGIVMAVRSKTGAYRTAEGQEVRTSSGWSTRAKVALALALLVFFLGPVALGGLAVLTGTALSIGLGLAGIVLAVRSETGAYRAVEGQAVKASGGMVTRWRVALSFALLVLILAPVAFMITAATVEGEANVAQWVVLGILGVGLAGILAAVRPMATAASLTLPFAVVTLMMGRWASDGNLGRILIGAGVVGIAVGVWGVSASDPAVARRWLLPFAIVAFVLALLGDALMFLLFGLQHLSL